MLRVLRWVCPVGWVTERLVYMREKGFAKEAIDAERQKIFAALTTFKEKIIGEP